MFLNGRAGDFFRGPGVVRGKGHDRVTAVEAGANSAATPSRRRRALRRIGRLLPTPAGTPFTFFYGLILLALAVYADVGDEATVNQLLRDSSTDAAHLADQPLVVLLASALWVAGGLLSAYGPAFALVGTALERRVGAARTAGVFLAGHVLATLATELPVAGAVAAGRLPEASLHRLDYGISFGLMACVGALSGLLPGRWRWTLLGVAGAICARDLIELVDPLASWGHPIALLTGVACHALIRDEARSRRAPRTPAPDPVRTPPPTATAAPVVPPPVSVPRPRAEGEAARRPEDALRRG